MRSIEFPACETLLTDLHEARFRVRAHDPVTSVEAAERSLLFSGSQAARIHSALQRLGSATAHEIGTATGLTVVQVDRRLPELMREGLTEVLQLNGEDVRRDGYRVWRALKKFVDEHNQK